MPERSFGRTIRFRRSKLGLSQSKLAELVGRSPSTIRAWERDQTTPNDPEVLKAVAAVLGIEQRMVFDKAGVPLPLVESSPTLEQELATLQPDNPGETQEGAGVSPITVTFHELDDLEPVEDSTPEEVADEEPSLENFDLPVEHDDSQGPSFVEPRPPYVVTPLTPPPTGPAYYSEVSYWEDPQERQLYRVRGIATAVGVVVLVLLLLYSLGKGLEAFGEWWDSFYGQLRL